MTLRQWLYWGVKQACSAKSGAAVGPSYTQDVTYIGHRATQLDP